MAMDWYYTTRFWNHILQVIPGFGLEQGMGYDLRPPMLPNHLNNYEANKTQLNIYEDISSYFIIWFISMKVGYQWLWTDTALQGSEIISSKLFRDLA